MSQPQWWQRAVFYQVYPRSFADSNGDGIGDLPGLTHRLDYLQDLGVDAIWLSPHYPSPQFDCGYDVADYRGVNPEYGSLDDFREFLDEAHRRGIRVVLDLVLNHTSLQHPWFLESKSSRDNPKRDWYIWRDGKVGGPPNNWLSTFGGSAWEYDETTGQYYYHFFFKEQPDLNWRNPQVKAAMFAAVRFWLDMGVDGFRIDAIGTVYEDPHLPNHPSPLSYPEMLRRLNNPAKTPAEQESLVSLWKEIFGYQVDQPGIHDLIRELRAVADEYEERVLIGETEEISYHGQSDELHMVFNFPLMNLSRLTAPGVVQNQHERLSALAAISPAEWPANTLGNHDISRVASRLDGGEHAGEWQRLALALMLTLRGTPFLYNGEEIGMQDLYLDKLADFRDLLGVWHYHALHDTLGAPPAEALAVAARESRDRCRTPMQWSAAPNAGFSPPGVRTWLPLHPNYQQGVNVADQESAPGSLLNFYKKMMHLRRTTPALMDGTYIPVKNEHFQILSFLRHEPSSDQTILVILNLSDQPYTLRFPDLDQYLPHLTGAAAYPLFSTRAHIAEREDVFKLVIGPFEVYLAEIRAGGPASA